MNVISFVSQKGGPGKSHLAISLAVVAQEAGERVCIIDLDPQRTTADWYDSRAAETPAVLEHNAVPSLTATLHRLAEAGFTLTIIDTPGHDSHATRGAMQAADLCLVPVKPDQANVKATMPTLTALHGMQRRFAMVINQAPTNKQVRLTTAVTMRMSSNGEVVPIPIGNRMDHPYAYALGQGVTEYAPGGKAAEEMTALWGWCRKQIEVGTYEQAKRRA